MTDNDIKEVEFEVSNDAASEPAANNQPAAGVVDARPAAGAQPVVNAQQSQSAGQGTAVPEGMPSKGTYTVLLVIGFLCGILWGLLSISPYSKMSKAIEAGDAATAWENAKKVKTFCLIGVAINILMVMFSCGVNS